MKKTAAASEIAAIARQAKQAKQNASKLPDSF
jgi:hypothetical protein